VTVRVWNALITSHLRKKKEDIAAAAVGRFVRALVPLVELFSHSFY